MRVCRARTCPAYLRSGALDQASEGLLLFTNDNAWAARITAPETHLDKTYHVQINALADESLARRMVEGVRTAEGDFLAAKRARLLRQGTRNSWLEIVLDEGKNRHLRRLLAALGFEVLRLMRIAIGPLELGNSGQRRLPASDRAGSALARRATGLIRIEKRKKD